MNKNLWGDAARYGFFIALAMILFEVVRMYVQNALLGLLSTAVFIVMLYIFVRKRATEQGTNGYSYGQCLGFIAAMMLCTGFLCGAYAALAANLLFVEQTNAAMAQQIAALQQTGVYSPEMLDMVVKYTSNPLMLVFSGILGYLIQGLFFGLIIAAFTKRNPDIFTEDGNNAQ